MVSPRAPRRRDGEEGPAGGTRPQYVALSAAAWAERAPSSWGEDGARWAEGVEGLAVAARGRAGRHLAGGQDAAFSGVGLGEAVGGVPDRAVELGRVGAVGASPVLLG